MSFRLGIGYKPRGDQETAIASLVQGLKDGEQHQVLLGVTGSGKTLLAQSLAKMLNVPFAIGGFQLWKTKVYWECGGYDETHLFAEDFALTKKVENIFDIINIKNYLNFFGLNEKFEDSKESLHLVCRYIYQAIQNDLVVARKNYEKEIINNANKVICTSKETKKLMAKKYPKKINDKFYVKEKSDFLFHSF